MGILPSIKGGYATGLWPHGLIDLFELPWKYESHLRSSSQMGLNMIHVLNSFNHQSARSALPASESMLEPVVASGSQALLVYDISGSMMSQACPQTEVLFSDLNWSEALEALWFWMLRRYSVFGLEHASIMSLKAVSRHNQGVTMHISISGIKPNLPQLSPASRFTGNPRIWSLMKSDV